MNTWTCPLEPKKTAEIVALLLCKRDGLTKQGRREQAAGGESRPVFVGCRLRRRWQGRKRVTGRCVWLLTMTRPGVWLCVCVSNREDVCICDICRRQILLMVASDVSPSYKWQRPMPPSKDLSCSFLHSLCPRVRVRWGEVRWRWYKCAAAAPYLLALSLSPLNPLLNSGRKSPWNL